MKPNLRNVLRQSSTDMHNSLKRIRTSAGFSLRDLAKVAGVGVSTIGNFENGRTEVSPEIVKKLSSVLRCSESELLESDGTAVERIIGGQLHAGIDPVLERSTQPELEEMLSDFVGTLRASRHPALKSAALDNIDKFSRAIRAKLHDGDDAPTKGIGKI